MQPKAAVVVPQEAWYAAPAVAPDDLQGGDVRREVGGDRGDDPGVGVQGRLGPRFRCQAHRTSRLLAYTDQ